MLSVEPVQAQSIFGYAGTATALFLNVTVRLPAFISAAKRALSTGIAVQGLGNVACGSTFESNIPFPLRFMIDTKVISGVEEEGHTEPMGSAYGLV